MAPKKGKNTKKDVRSDKVQKSYPVVTSSVCEVCTTQCVAGITYMARMSMDGAKGTGVVCRKSDFV